MAQNFNYNSIFGRIQIDNSQDIPAQLTPTLQNNTSLYGNRRDINSQGFINETSLPIPIPKSGFPIYSYYQLYQLPPNIVANGDSLATWFKNCGYNVNYGLSGSLTLNNIIGSINNTNTKYVELYFQNQIYNTQVLANRNINGNVTINSTPSVIGSLIDVNNGSYNINVESTSGNLTNNASADDTFISTNSFNSAIKVGDICNFIGTGSITFNVITDQSAVGTSLNINTQVGGFSFLIGKTITGTGIATGTIISNISGSTLTLSQATTAIVTSGTVLTVSSVDYSMLNLVLSIKSINAVTKTIAFNENINFNTIGNATTLVDKSSTVNCDTVVIISLNAGATYSDFSSLSSVINYTIQNGELDQMNTEPFVYNLYVAARSLALMSSINPNATLGAPAVYFSILPDRANTDYFSPISTPYNLGNPLSVSSTATNAIISFAINTANASLIPNLTLGNSTLTQGTSTGVIQGWIFNGNNIDVNILTSNPFSTSSPVTLNLDTTITIMSIRNSYFSKNGLSLRTQPCIYEFNNINGISTYQQIFDDTINLNLPITANSGQGNCSIVFGNLSFNPQQAYSYFKGNSLLFNFDYFEPVYFPYIYRSGTRPMTVASVMCAMAAIMASNNYPYNPANDILLDGITNSNVPADWIDSSPNGIADTIAQQGVNVILSNGQGQQYLNYGATGLTSINGVSIREFNPTYIADVKDYNRKAVYLICKQSGVGQVRQNEQTILNVHSKIVNLLNAQSKDGIIPSNIVNTLVGQIIVRRSSQNPLGLYIYYPLVQNPAFLNAYVEIDNFSINSTF